MTIRVLIAEDSPTQAEELRLILESEGFEVTRAEDGHSALARLERAPTFDLIISDIVMPGMSGYELCRKVKSQPQLRTIPVILVTTLSDPLDIVKGLECGADNFVPKPYQPEYLVDRIRTLLANRAARSKDTLRLGIEVLFLGRKFTITSDKEQILDLLIATFEDMVRTNRNLQSSRAELARAKVKLEEYAHRLEARAQESEKRHQRLLEYASDAVLISDEGMTILEINRQAERLFGRSADEIVGCCMEALFTEAEHPRIDDLRSSGKGERSPTKLSDMEIARPDHEPCFADAAVTTVDIGGRRLRMTLLHDVTEQRKMRAQLLIADRMVSMGTLAAGVGHEINNPLATIMANLELISRELDRADGDGASLSFADLRDMLGDAREAADRIRQIVKDVKIFSRSEDDKIEAIEVRRVIESSLRMAWNEIRHRAQLVKDYGRVPAVMANESRLGQVFLNLIVNAAQAIPEGGAADDEIRIRTYTEESGERVVIEVSDTGAGMSSEVQRRLFSPFFTTKPPGVGTGLGLSICHRIITELGGAISVDSAPGRGSTFRVSLPTATDEPVRRAPHASTAQPARRRGRVLVVDDEPMVCSVLRRALSAEHDVDVETSAQQALERIQAGAEYDVILCDLMMPQLSGMDFFRELNATSAQHARRMIFLTGGAFTSGARAFLDEVDLVHVEKPFDTDQVRDIVNARIK